MLFRVTVAVYCENHTEHINALCGQNAEFPTLKEVVHIVTTGFWKFRLKIYAQGSSRDVIWD
jgi:hypothetical protein